MNNQSIKVNIARVKQIRLGPRLAIRRLLRSFEPLEKPPKPPPAKP